MKLTALIIPTPRTDAQAKKLLGYPIGDIVEADFSRILERELTQCQWESGTASQTIATIIRIVDAEVEREDKDRSGDCPACHNRANNIRDEISEHISSTPPRNHVRRELLESADTLRKAADSLSVASEAVCEMANNGGDHWTEIDTLRDAIKACDLASHNFCADLTEAREELTK